jgi:hypothetical protein
MIRFAIVRPERRGQTSLQRGLVRAVVAQALAGAHCAGSLRIRHPGPPCVRRAGPPCVRRAGAPRVRRAGAPCISAVAVACQRRCGAAFRSARQDPMHQKRVGRVRGRPVRHPHGHGENPLHQSARHSRRRGTLHGGTTPCTRGAWSGLALGGAEPRQDPMHQKRVPVLPGALRDRMRPSRQNPMHQSAPRWRRRGTPGDGMTPCPSAAPLTWAPRGTEQRQNPIHQRSVFGLPGALRDRMHRHGQNPIHQKSAPAPPAARLSVRGQAA